MVLLDHVRNTLATLHPRLDQLGEHLEDSLAWATVLLLQDGRGNTIELEAEVGFLPRSKRPGFDRGIVRVVGVVREAGGR